MMVLQVCRVLNIQWLVHKDLKVLIIHQIQHLMEKLDYKVLEEIS